MPYKPTRIGVVDSGFSERQNVVSSASFVLHDHQLWLEDCQPDRLDHGTSVIEVIEAVAPGSEIVSAQVFQDRYTTSAVQVAAAIDWLIAEGVQVINLSLGLRNDSDALREACTKAMAQGATLCAASPARGEPVYPSAYPGVFRMTGDARCERREISHLNSRFADFGACVRPMDGALGSSGASIGCAHLTAHVAGYLKGYQKAGFDDVRDWLTTRARYHGPEQKGRVHG